MLGEEFLGLLHAAANEVSWLHDRLQLFQVHRETRIIRDPLQQIIRLSFFLDHSSGCHGMHADGLMQLLTVSAHLHAVHHDVFRRHERQLVHQMALDDLRIDDQALCDVQIQVQDAIDGQECFRHGNALIGRIVQRALEPLRGSHDGRVHDIGDDIVRQRSHALAAHRIALVRHGAGADLALFKRLLNFLEVLEQANVIGEFMRALRDGAQHAEHTEIIFAGICLRGHRVAGVIAHLFRDQLIELLDFVRIAVKQLHEARLGAGRPFAAQQLLVFEQPAQLLIIHEQIMRPDAGALAQRGRLSRLEMRECQHRQILVLQRELFQTRHHVDQLALDQLHGLMHQDEIGIVRGLAWTSVGGDTLQIEVNTMPGRGEFRLTGQLGDVMKESAQAGISYIRSVSSQYHISDEYFRKHDIHIHIPEGAVPKDGPSAGVTMVTAMISAITKIPVRADVAMTGEITLRGRVLPIGGLKEKLLAARNAGMKIVFVPSKNKPDVEEISTEITKGLDIRYAETMEDILQVALTGKISEKKSGKKKKKVEDE